MADERELADLVRRALLLLGASAAVPILDHDTDAHARLSEGGDWAGHDDWSGHDDWGHWDCDWSHWKDWSGDWDDWSDSAACWENWDSDYVAWTGNWVDWSDC